MERERERLRDYDLRILTLWGCERQAHMISPATDITRTQSIDLSPLQTVGKSHARAALLNFHRVQRYMLKLRYHV